MSNSVTLGGQIAVITGGSRGIGREIARALAAAGAKVAITARNQDKLAETVAIIEEQGGTCRAYAMDVTDEEQVQTAIQAILSDFGQIDLLVNNAGIADGAPFPWEMDSNAWWRVIDVNVRGVFLCSKYVLQHMTQRRSGRIINIGSGVGLGPEPMASSYSISKAALLRLTDSFALAAQDFGISMFAISPGLVLTDMTRVMPGIDDFVADDFTPIERTGELCVLLASGQADALTGRYIHVRYDDIHDLIARSDEVVEKDLQTLRLRQ
jgi:3-oxoacyl-[acyl-carrier protein] reductase